jgi:DNA-directed RNA polymerase subunit RPC12/RpoP/cbb3-type cytochrome oxidase subunit 3
MSEFKFRCPACGQDILCDTTHVGTQIACPACKATVIVPKETAGTAAQRTSKLAIASLVCSLLSLVTCIGWLPGIICGHMAKSRIRRNPSLKGNGLATAGLAIGYLFLILGVCIIAVHVWTFSKAMKHGFENAKHDLATNNFVITQTHPTTVSNDNEQAEPVEPETVVTNSQQPEPAKPEPVVINNQQIEPAKSGWASDVSKISFPDHPVSGRLHGSDFTLKTVSFRNGDLKITSENGMLLDVFRLDESVEGQRYEIHSIDNDSTNPHIKMTWNEGDVVQTSTYIKGYGMKLQFDQAINRTISGRIYLCLPDDSKSYVAGTFKVRLPKQK